MFAEIGHVNVRSGRSPGAKTKQALFDKECQRMLDRTRSSTLTKANAMSDSPSKYSINALAQACWSPRLRLEKMKNWDGLGLAGLGWPGGWLLDEPDGLLAGQFHVQSHAPRLIPRTTLDSTLAHDSTLNPHSTLHASVKWLDSISDE